MICKECGEEMVTHTGYETTLVGYLSPQGHNHDDNCRNKTYKCKNGHRLFLSERNSCHACDWVGKRTCFCHEGEKVDKWPDARELAYDDFCRFS